MNDIYAYGDGGSGPKVTREMQQDRASTPPPAHSEVDLCNHLDFLPPLIAKVECLNLAMVSPS